MRARIAFDHMISKLDAQRLDLQNIRNQAAISAAVNGVIASVFAPIVPPEIFHNALDVEAHFGTTFVAILLIVVFAASLVLSIRVLTGWRDFVFSFDTKIMINNSSDEIFFHKYVKDGEIYFLRNEAGITEAQNSLWWASVLGWVQIIFWLFLFIGGNQLGN